MAGWRWWGAVWLGTLLVGDVLCPGLKAAPPANDTCGGIGTQFVIPSSGPFPYLTIPLNLTEATSAGDLVPPCQTNVTRGVWYRFTPTQGGLYRLSTCTESGTATTEKDTVLAVTQAASCSGPFSYVACVDDQCGYQAELLVELTAGVRYYLLVWQYNENLPTAGVVQLLVDLLRPPSNDTCQTAQEIVLNAPVEGSTILARNDHQLNDGACFAGKGQTVSLAAGGEVVYAFTAPAAGPYSFKVTGYGSGDVVLYVTGNCGLGEVAGCLGAANRSRAGTAEEVCGVMLGAGQRVFIFVDQDLPAEGSFFRLAVTPYWPEEEPNNLPQEANAFALGVSGSISHEFDHDFFALGTPGPGQRVFALVDGEASSVTDYDLRITTLTDVLEYDDGDNDFMFGNRSPNVAGTPLPGGKAFIKVSYNAPPGFLGAEPYRLYAVVQPPLQLAAMETEPNDTLVLANAPLNNYVYGALPLPGPSTDVDLFAFEARAGDVVFIGLDGDPLRDNSPLDAKLALLDEAGEQLLLVDDPNALSDTNRTTYLLDAYGPRSPGEGLVYQVNRTGRYYVRVGAGALARPEEGTGDYLLSISRNGLIGSAGRQDPPVFRAVSRLPDSGATLRLQGTPGASYRIEVSQDLLVWGTLGVGMADAQGLFQVRDGASPTPASRFYRAVWP